MELFVSCGSGLEFLLEQELRELGFDRVRGGFRGVYIEEASPEAVYVCNYTSRLATRVLRPLLNFKCRHKEDLYQAVKNIDWLPYFKNGETLAVDTAGEHPLLTHTLFASQVVKDAICDALVEKTGERPSVNLKAPDIRLHLYLRHSTGVLSLDTSGEPLHKRGYREEAGEAPLRETLAAALLRLANYNPSEILIDPCVGSGTFLIEAAMAASKTPPGFFRKRWGFLNDPKFSQSLWEKVKNEADSRRIPLAPNMFWGIEINKFLYQSLLGLIKKLGWSHAIKLINHDFRDAEFSVRPTFLITNPPYGRRLSEESALVPVYRALGEFMKRKMAEKSKGFILTGNLPLSKEVGLAAKKRTVIDNGGIEARFLEFDIWNSPPPSELSLET